MAPNQATREQVILPERTDKPETTEKRIIGEPFNPWRQLCGFYPPGVVSTRRNLTDGPKRVYELLVRRAGQRGTCWPSYQTIANDLGKSERQVRSDIKTLESTRLIRHKKRDGRRSNTYEFLWHECFERQCTDVQMNSSQSGAGTVERPSTAGQSKTALNTADNEARFERQATASSSGSGLPTNLVIEFSKDKKQDRSNHTTVAAKNSSLPDDFDSQQEREPKNHSPEVTSKSKAAMHTYPPKDFDFIESCLKSYTGKSPTRSAVHNVLIAAQGLPVEQIWEAFRAKWPQHKPSEKTGPGFGWFEAVIASKVAPQTIAGPRVAQSVAGNSHAHGAHESRTDCVSDQSQELKCTDAPGPQQCERCNGTGMFLYNAHSVFCGCAAGDAVRGNERLKLAHTE